MSKRNRNARNVNEFEPEMKKALTLLGNTVTEVKSNYPDLPSFSQEGATTITSLRDSDKFLGPEMPHGQKLLVRAALEKFGLDTYSFIKQTIAPAQRPLVREKIQDLPLSYNATDVITEAGTLNYLDVSIGGGGAFPAHQRLHNTYYGLSSATPDEDDLFPGSALHITQYSGKNFAPKIELIKDYATREEIEFNNMVDSEVYASEAGKEALLGTPVATQLESPDPMIRAAAQATLDRRESAKQQREAGFATPTPEDIDLLREQILELFKTN